MGIFDSFKKHYETTDSAVDPILVTHYYRNNFNQVKEALMQSAKELDYKVTYENDERKEFVFKHSDSEVIITVININPIETAVDFTVNTSGVFSFGKGKKLIQELYQNLDKRLKVKN